MFDDLILLLNKHETAECYNVFVSSDPCRPPLLFLGLILPLQIKIIAPHLKNLVAARTSHMPDKALNSRFLFALAPDCSVFTRDHKAENSDFSRVDSIIEFKEGSSDPFVDDSNSEGKGQGEGKDNPFLCKEGPNLEVLGQLTAYATATLGAQYRTHLFMVLIAGEYARLIRWDRGGAVVTERIPFNKEPHFLDFLTRYDITSREDRGHDSTVSVPSEGEIESAMRVVKEWAKAKAFLVVTMSHRRFIIPRPEVRLDIPVGRWTRSSIAFDVDKQCRVYLKDSWRIRLDDIEPEGEIYHRLHRSNVPNIPPCLLSGDVGDDTHHQSRTHEVSHEYNPHHSYWKITVHRHYRIVLGAIGRPLEKFTHTQELVKAMHAALKGKITIFLAVSLHNLTYITAHEAAYKSGVLHRDISPGNILIVDSDELPRDDQPKSEIDGGMLIDWDLSKFVSQDDRPSGIRQYTRTVN